MPILYKYPRAGFTFSELVTVIAIVSALSIIVIPGYLHLLPNIRLKAAARELYTNMHQAKITAIKENRYWAIVFDTTNNRYYICSDWGPDHDWSGDNDDIGKGDNVIAKTVSLGNYKSGVAYGSGGYTPEKKVSFTSSVATFNSRGTCKSGYIYLANENKNDAFRIGTLSSGIIRIARWRGDHWEY